MMFTNVDTFTLLGDIHGDMTVLDSVMRESIDDPVIQLGDFGFGDEWKYANKMYSPEELSVVGGNHDEYPVAITTGIYLGDFGLLNDRFSGINGKVMFIRGALSIDRDSRTPGFNWWREEELDFNTSNKLLDFYEEHKPDVVLSHDCPANVVHAMCGTLIENWTSTLLWECYKIHQPSRWYFGHHHRKFQKQVGKTRFRCLDINEAISVEL